MKIEMLLDILIRFIKYRLNNIVMNTKEYTPNINVSLIGVEIVAS